MRTDAGAEGLERVYGLVVVCAVCCERPHRALRDRNQLTALPESFGQLAALQELGLSRASACAECRCICGPWTVEQGERWAGA